MQTLPGNHTAVLTRQENKAGCNLRRLRRTTHRCSTKLVLRLFVHGRGDKRSPDWPRADGVDTDAFGNLLVMQSTGESHNGAFAGSVVEEIRAANVCVDGRAVADCVAALHVLKGVLGEVEVGVDVGVEGLEPLVSLVQH